MANTIRPLKIFIASPSDPADERKAFQEQTESH
jgi:hypothetical protein